MRSETAHYILAFMFDMLQFFIQFFSTLKQWESDDSKYDFQGLKYGKIHWDLPFYFNYSPVYTIPGSGKLINSILSVISHICPVM